MNFGNTLRLPVAIFLTAQRVSIHISARCGIKQFITLTTDEHVCLIELVHLRSFLCELQD